METLAEAKRWQMIGIAAVAITVAVYFWWKNPDTRLVVLSFGLLGTLAAMCAAHLLNHISEYGQKRPAARLIIAPIIFLVLMIQTADRAARAAGFNESHMEIKWCGGFFLAAMVMVIATIRLQKLLPAGTAAAKPAATLPAAPPPKPGV